MMNKKGALELSITAIVILIIAITILALGIGFIKKQFTAGTEMVGGKLTEIKEQMKEDIRTSGELLVVNMAKTDFSIGKEQTILIGVKNTLKNKEGGDKVCFWLQVKCLRAFNAQNKCPSAVLPTDEVIVGGYDPDAELGQLLTVNWFSSLLSQFDVRNFDAGVYPAGMLVTEAQPDHYQMEMNVFRAADQLNCANTQEEPILYATKSFIISVK